MPGLNGAETRDIWPESMPLESSREIRFPQLSQEVYRVTSPPTDTYNCMAWAAGDATRSWWPAANYYWPEYAPLEETLASFQAVFEGMGYFQCESDALETGYEKIALYVDDDGVPTHAARQLQSGAWTSKLGDWEDIEHDSLFALESAPFMNSLYGAVALVLRRPTRPGTA